jgi:hypothetical protein
MRIILYLLILFLVFGTAQSGVAEELYLGRVLSVDPEAGRMTVSLMEAGEKSADGKSKGSGVEVTSPEGRLPERLAPGSIVRIWGNLTGENGRLDAARILLTGTTPRGKDPTGVRRRIGKGRGRFGGRGGGKGHGRR